MPARHSVTTTVVIPTWKRAGWLDRCLAALSMQDKEPEEVLVVGRAEDVEARLITEKWAREGSLKSRWVEVEEPGHVIPVRRGLTESRGEIVAFLDDDTEPGVHWLKNLLASFDQGNVGCVGGRVDTPGWSGKVHGDAGAIRWYGRHVGNIGAFEGAVPHEVDGVMECNWAWRSSVLSALDFEPVFQDGDASMYGLDLCLQAKERGYRVVYQPRATVVHHVAPRDPVLDRAAWPERTRAYSRNYTYIALRHFSGLRRLAFLVWWWLVGERGAYGVATAVYDLVAHETHDVLPLIRASWKGKWEGVRAWQASCR